MCQSQVVTAGQTFCVKAAKTPEVPLTFPDKQIPRKKASFVFFLMVICASD